MGDQPNSPGARRPEIGVTFRVVSGKSSSRARGVSVRDASTCAMALVD